MSAGKISITLHGEKMKGSWTLVKMKADDNNWLLIKHRTLRSRPDGHPGK